MAAQRARNRDSETAWENELRGIPPMTLIQLKNETFGWTLTTSAIFHLFIVLGISFVMPPSTEKQMFSPPLKITLVSTFSEESPDQTDTLAQSNSRGENNSSNAIAVTAHRQPGDTNQQQRDQAMTQDSEPSQQVPRQKSAKAAQAKLTREQLTAEINLAYLNSQANPREKYISAKTRKWQHAAYVEKWRLQVERVGNLNYPEAARKLKIEGDLVLDVAINSDGSIYSVKLFRSSGHKLLDDAATRIVHIASPFETFSPEMKADLDILHIVRTWEFGQNRGFTTSHQ